MKKIMCVKDAYSNDEFIAKEFSKRGMKVAKAYGFQEAFHIMRTFVPDAVLVDIKSLEEDSGKQFVQSLRENSRLSHIPLVGIFDCDLPQDLTKFRAWGCDDFFSKEQDMGAITGQVELVIENSRKQVPKVLLMEDEPEFIKLVKEALGPVGVSVVDVTNGFDAMRVFKTQNFDMIITDIMVKGFNGFQLIDFVLKKGEGIPIVVITGAYPNGFDQYAKKLGIRDYFEKPFDLEAFSDRIGEILDEARGKNKAEPVALGE